MMGENTSQSAPVDGKVQPPGKKASTLVDALFDLGLSWADFGVGQGKRALEQSAKRLERAARALSELQQRLKKEPAERSS